MSVTCAPGADDMVGNGSIGSLVVGAPGTGASASSVAAMASVAVLSPSFPVPCVLCTTRAAMSSGGVSVAVLLRTAAVADDDGFAVGLASFGAAPVSSGSSVRAGPALGTVAYWPLSPW